MAADWMAGQDAGVLLCFDAHRFEGQRRLLGALGERCERLAVATIGNSDDEELVADRAAVVRTCGFQACQLLAALRTIFNGPGARSKRI
jgi:hypothetical protein